MSDKDNEYIQKMNEWSKCDKCNLCTTRDRVVFGAGSLTPKIFIIGEAPGPDEDEYGIPFCGKTGKLLRQVLEKNNISLLDEVYITNIVGCIPKDTVESKFRKPTQKEVDACYPRLDYIINNIANEANVTMLLGKTAYAGYVSHISKLSASPLSYTNIESTTKIGDMLGWHEIAGKNIYVTYHPSYIERNRHSDSKEFKQWINDFAIVKNFIQTKEKLKRS